MSRLDIQDSFMTLYNKNNSYRYFVLTSQNGDIYTLKGNGYNVFGDNLIYKISDGIHMFKTNAIFKDVDLMGNESYPDDTLMTYRVNKGNVLIQTEDGMERKLESGDILIAASNFKMSKFHSFNKEVEFVGVTYYYEAIVESIKNQSLNQSFLEKFYNSDLIQNIFIHRGNYKINNIFDELENAINRNKKILMKAKSLELLSESDSFYRNLMQIDNKSLSKDNKKLFNEIKNFLDENLTHYYPMEFIANKFGISLSSLKNLFNEACGLSPYRYHLDKRLEKAAELLEKTDYKVNVIYKRTGFDHHGNFSKAFYKKYQCTPSQYRKKEGKE